MIWDKVCRIVDLAHSRKEHAVEDLAAMHSLMQEAKLFVIDAKPEEFLPERHDKEYKDWLNENFFLPFRVTAIEDACSLIILYDTRAHQRGGACERQWIGVCDWHKHLWVSAGVIDEMIWEHDHCQVVGHPMDCFVVTYDGEWICGEEEVAQFGGFTNAELAERLTQNAWKAVEEIAYFNDPRNFILEESLAPKRQKKTKAAKKLKRVHQRPTYTVLKPTQIRRRMRLPEPEQGGAKRRPHERRAHPRTFSDDEKRWPKMHGKTIIVKSSWIGPKESVVGNRRYRVLVDLLPPQLERGESGQ